MKTPVSRRDFLKTSALAAGAGLTASSKVDSPDTAVPGRAPRSMHTGQNSIAPESSLPQLGQVR